ncbi:hypothetical protein EON64_06470 [archaeon]|nr:MAG: hypothetical protein EON64_06470 [archaeon]
MMSVLLRPAGDPVASSYGNAYLTSKQLLKIKAGDKFEVLCNDNKHYRVEVKEFNPATVEGTLHFCFWKTRFDYQGSLRAVYLSPDGLYSEGKLSAQNTYLVSLPARPAKRGKPAVSAGSAEFAEKTRYPEDFLTKPRLFSGRRRLRENSNGNEESKDRDSPDSPVRSQSSGSPPQKKAPRTGEGGGDKGGSSHFLLQHFSFEDDSRAGSTEPPSRESQEPTGSNTISTTSPPSNMGGGSLNTDAISTSPGKVATTAGMEFQEAAIDMDTATSHRDGITGESGRISREGDLHLSALQATCESTSGINDAALEEPIVAIGGRESSAVPPAVIPAASAVRVVESIPPSIQLVPQSLPALGSEACEQLRGLQADLQQGIRQARAVRAQLAQYAVQLQQASCSPEDEHVLVRCSSAHNIRQLLGARLHIDTILLTLVCAAADWVPLRGDSVHTEDAAFKVPQGTLPLQTEQESGEMDQHRETAAEEPLDPLQAEQDCDDSDSDASSEPSQQAATSFSTWTAWAFGRIMKNSK